MYNSSNTIKWQKKKKTQRNSEEIPATISRIIDKGEQDVNT